MTDRLWDEHGHVKGAKAFVKPAMDRTVDGFARALNHQAMRFAIRSLAPWTQHLEGCSRRSRCECGLNQMIALLSSEKEAKP